MNRTGAPADCWLLCMIHASYIQKILSCEALDGNVPQGMLYGVSPDISIILLYTFYQPVFYATHNQSYPSVSEERAARWVGFGEHVGDPLTHKHLDDDTKKILYRSAVRPSDCAHPNKRLVPDGGENSKTPKPIVFVKMIVNLLPNPWQNLTLMTLLAGPSYSQRMNKEKGLEPLSRRKVIETSKHLDDQHDNAIEKINFHLDVGQRRDEAIMSYVQILDHLDHQEQHEDLYKFRAITGHQGPLSPQDENYNGSKYNVMVEWETGEITEETLSLIAADGPVTCAVYAKKHDLLHLDGWKRLKYIAKNQKQLTRAINQSKIRQVRRSAVCQFGFLIPKDYKQALQLDEQNGNSKWYNATKLEMDQINEYKVFQDHVRAQIDPKSRKVSNAPDGYQKIRVHLIFAVKHDGRHKARLVAGGHLTPDPIESIYSGVVSIRSLRLVIFLAKLNNLEVWGAEIGNAYLEAKTKEKLYVVAGPEFEELEGHILVIYKALYGLKSSVLRWSQKIHDIMLDMGFSPGKADPCVWLRKANAPPNMNMLLYMLMTFSLHVLALQTSFIPLKRSTTSKSREMDL